MLLTLIKQKLIITIKRKKKKLQYLCGNKKMKTNHRK